MTSLTRNAVNAARPMSAVMVNGWVRSPPGTPVNLRRRRSGRMTRRHHPAAPRRERRWIAPCDGTLPRQPSRHDRGVDGSASGRTITGKMSECRPALSTGWASRGGIVHAREDSSTFSRSSSPLMRRLISSSLISGGSSVARGGQVHRRWSYQAHPSQPGMCRPWNVWQRRTVTPRPAPGACLRCVPVAAPGTPG
jgi:hypothetical protein